MITAIQPTITNSDLDNLVELLDILAGADILSEEGLESLANVQAKVFDSFGLYTDDDVVRILEEAQESIQYG